MTSTSCTLVILGASGDLTQRLLLPGIGSMLKQQPERDLRIIGCDRATMSDHEFAALLTRTLVEGGASEQVARRIADGSTYVTGDVTNADVLAQVLAVAEGKGAGNGSSEGPSNRRGDGLRTGPGDGAHNATGRIICYFALPPAVAKLACDSLGTISLPNSLHLALEKPFGGDLASAKALNAVLEGLVSEAHVHRVDHFIGKSTVLDLLALRSSNRLFQTIWCAEHIESVEIAYDESLALEGRAGYYDHAGALRDMIQSHLLQVLALVAMELPASINSRDLQDAKAAALRATRLWGGTSETASKRARYTAGTVRGREVPDYVSEERVHPERGTETLAALTLEVANNRWAGVPFTLRSGKALGETSKHVVITFRPVNHLPEGFTGAEPRDQLILSLGADTMQLRMTTNGPSNPLQLEQSVFTATLREPELEPYGEVLAGILDGDSLLTVRGDTAEECWRICDPVLAAWAEGQVPLEDYPAGSNVPAGWSSALR